MPRNALLLLSRLMFTALFVPSGFQALSDIAGTTGYFAGLGLPLPTLAAWGTGLVVLSGRGVFHGHAGVHELPGCSSWSVSRPGSRRCCLPPSALPPVSSAITARVAATRCSPSCTSKC